MSTRRDVSGVPMQGGYVAKQCPVRAQNDALQPAEPLPVSPILQRRFAKGREFEAEVVAELLARHPSAVAVDRGETAGREAATARALASGATLILGSRLPSDPAGRRVGEPDLLVAAQAGGYRAVDIKHHSTLELTDPPGRGLPGLCAELDQLSLEAAATGEASARKRQEDLLQLAHYQRMLEAAGLAAAGLRFGGIIGTERTVVWFDLDAPIWRTPSSSDTTKMRSTLEIYDFEFDFRLDIIAVAQQHASDPSVDLLVVPIKVSECGECPWWGYCGPQLRAGAGDVSLVARVGWREWNAHRERGVTDRAALAALDVGTAQLIAAGVDVAALRALASEADPQALVAELAGFSRRKAQITKLDTAGIHTAGEALGLDGATAAYSDAGLSSLPEQIDRARAALGPEPVYRRRGVDQISAFRADVEVDVDMENVEEGVYLWGALLTDRSGRANREAGYHPFVTWEPLTPEVALENFRVFWSWLLGARQEAAAAGRSFHAYCYNASAENTYLRALGDAAGLRDEVEALIASDEWVDMLRVFDIQLITGGGSGLKAVAPLAGFSWGVDDPGGAESMVRYDVAVGEESEAEREAARAWLLTYNQGDVEATLALRGWLDTEAGSAPSVRDLPSVPGE